MGLVLKGSRSRHLHAFFSQAQLLRWALGNPTAKPSLLPEGGHVELKREVWGWKRGLGDEHGTMQ